MIISDAKILLEWLSVKKKIVITTHQKPDADALGSSLGLANILKKKGHEVLVISPTDYPDFLKWMKGNDEVLVYNEKINAQVNESIDSADLVFCLDFNTLSRIDPLGEMVRASKARKMLIDHHLEPEQFADFSRWSTEAAATCELVYELIVDMGWVDDIDNDIANCLYSGIMTDTGNFKHPNVTRNVFDICGDLVGHGCDTAYVARMIYDTNTVDRLHLMGYALSEKLVIMPEFNTAYISLTHEEMRSFNFKTGDTEGLVNYALSIKGINVAALFTEQPDKVKISFRSVGDISVNQLARENFSGGGHRNAAGGQSEASLQDTIDLFKSVLQNNMEKLNISN